MRTSSHCLTRRRTLMHAHSLGAAAMEHLRTQLHVRYLELRGAQAFFVRLGEDAAAHYTEISAFSRPSSEQRRLVASRRPAQRLTPGLPREAGIVNRGHPNFDRCRSAYSASDVEPSTRPGDEVA
jgi:hypothetical protein